MKQLLEKTILLLICISLISCITDFKSNNLSFNSEQWKNSDLRLRGQMVEDLAKSKVLESKTKTEVKDLLGEPFYINSMPNKAENWSYKTDKGYKIDGDNIWIHWLHVEFKENGTVNKGYITD